jgi:hypothetical protein
MQPRLGHRHFAAPRRPATPQERASKAVTRALRGVFVSSIKLSLFHAGFTWWAGGAGGLEGGGKGKREGGRRRGRLERCG